jgi:ankyrin repeat protein
MHSTTNSVITPSNPVLTDLATKRATRTGEIHLKVSVASPFPIASGLHPHANFELRKRWEVFGQHATQHELLRSSANEPHFCIPATSTHVVKNTERQSLISHQTTLNNSLLDETTVSVTWTGDFLLEGKEVIELPVRFSENGKNHEALLPTGETIAVKVIERNGRKLYVEDGKWHNGGTGDGRHHQMLRGTKVGNVFIADTEQPNLSRIFDGLPLREMINGGAGVNFHRLLMQAYDVEDIEKLLSTGKLSLADLLARDEDGWTALQVAVKDCNYQVVSFLLQQDEIDVDGEHEEGFTALHLAVQESDLNGSFFVHMLAPKADLNKKDADGMAALHHAAKSDHDQVVKALAEYDRCNLNIKNSAGETALHIAASNGYRKVVDAFLDTKVDLNKKDADGMTALHRAAKSGHDQVVKALAENNRCNVNIKNSAGETALHIAASNGYRKVVDGLLESNNINVDAKNGDSLTALKLAIQGNHADIVAVLQNQKLRESEKPQEKRVRFSAFGFLKSRTPTLSAPQLFETITAASPEQRAQHFTKPNIKILESWMGFPRKPNEAPVIAKHPSSIAADELVPADQQAQSIATFVTLLPQSELSISDQKEGLHVLDKVLDAMGNDDNDDKAQTAKAKALEILAENLRDFSDECLKVVFEKCLTPKHLLNLRATDREILLAYCKLEVEGLKDSKEQLKLIGQLASLIEDTVAVAAQTPVPSDEATPTTTPLVLASTLTTDVEFSDFNKHLTTWEKTREGVPGLRKKIEIGLQDSHQKIYASGLKLKSLPQGFNALSKVKYIDLSNNDLRELPADFGDWLPEWEINLKGNKKLSNKAIETLRKYKDEDNRRIDFDEPTGAKSPGDSNSIRSRASTIESRQSARIGETASIYSSSRTSARTAATESTFSGMKTIDQEIQAAIDEELEAIEAKYIDVPLLKIYFHGVNEFAKAILSSAITHHPSLPYLPSASVPIGSNIAAALGSKLAVVGPAIQPLINAFYQRKSNQLNLMLTRLMGEEGPDEIARFAHTAARMLASLNENKLAQLHTSSMLDKGKQTFRHAAAQLRGTAGDGPLQSTAAAMGEEDFMKILLGMTSEKNPGTSLEQKFLFAVEQFCKDEKFSFDKAKIEKTINKAWGAPNVSSHLPLTKEPIVQKMVRSIKTVQAENRLLKREQQSTHAMMQNILSRVIALEGENRLLRETVNVARLPMIGNWRAQGKTSADVAYRAARKEIVVKDSPIEGGYVILPNDASDGHPVPILAYSLPEVGAGVYHEAQRGHLCGLNAMNMLSLYYGNNNAALLITENQFFPFLEDLARTKFVNATVRHKWLHEHKQLIDLRDVVAYYHQHHDMSLPEMVAGNGSLLVDGSLSLAPGIECSDLDAADAVALTYTTRTNADHTVMIARNGTQIFAYDSRYSEPKLLDGATTSEAIADFLKNHAQSRIGHEELGVAFDICLPKEQAEVEDTI